MSRLSRTANRIIAAGLGLAALMVGSASAEPTTPDSTPPSRPGTPSATQILSGSARLEWAASTDDVGVAGYDVLRSGVVVGDASEPSFLATGLDDDTAYTFSVRARDAAGNASEPSPSIAFRTPPAQVPPTTPEPELGMPFDVAGSAAIKSLVRGTVPLSGILLDTHANTDTGSFSGAFALGAATGKLTALGFLPVVATVYIEAKQGLAGTLTGTTLVASTVVRIKLPLVTLFGLPLISGGNCQTSKPSAIRLRSNGAGFTMARGGVLTATFGISDLTGCGALNGLVSPLTASNANALAIKLTPQP